VTLLLNIFANNILPAFLVVGAGALLGVTIRPDVKAISRMTFYALTPCLIFSGLTSSPLDGNELTQIAVFGVTVSLVLAGLAWLIAALLRWDSVRTRALVLPVLVINAGNFGLSVTLFAFGKEAQARAMIYFIATAVLGNSLGVAIAAGGSSWRKVLANVARVPMIYATIGALVVNAVDAIVVPELIMRPIDLLGRAAVPMMLLILGLQLVRSAGTVRDHVASISIATALRLVVAPFLAAGVAVLTGVQGITYQTCMLEASMPSGVTSTVISLEYDLEPEAVTGTVFFSTLLSALTLSAVISVIR